MVPNLRNSYEMGMLIEGPLYLQVQCREWEENHEFCGIEITWLEGDVRH